jgi:hypothetical protein
MGDMPMRAQMAAAGYGGGAPTKQGAKTFLQKKGYGDELNLPEIERIKAVGVSDSQLARWIKKQEVPLGSQAAAKFGIDRLSSGANLRPEYVEQFREAGYSNKDIRKAYEGTKGTIDERAAEMIAPKEKSFDLSSYDIASKGGKNFGIRDIEFLKSKGLGEKEIQDYAAGLDPSLIGRKARAGLGVLAPTQSGEENAVLGRKEQRIQELQEDKQSLLDQLKSLKTSTEEAPEPEKAQELLNKTITNITSTSKPETATVSTPTMLGGTQVVSPSVMYGGSFSPTMRAPITQTIRGGMDMGDIKISSEMSPTYKDIGNIAAGVEGATGETSSQTAGVTTDVGGIREEVDNLIEKAKAKKK